METFGLVIVPKESVEQAVITAQAAEAAGFDFALVADEGFNVDVYVVLSAILSHTRRLRLAPITNPFTRHPAVTAAALATLSSLAPGRVFLAPVAGGSLALDPMALPGRQPAVACREMIAIVRALLSGEKCDFHGTRFSLRGAQLQIPASPVDVWVIGRGARMLQVAGECADVAVVTSKLTLADTVGAVRAAAAQRNQPLEMAWLGLMGFTPAIIEQMRPHYTYVLPNSPAPVLAELGLTAEWVAELKQVREQQGVAAAAERISDDLLRRNMVLGTPAECAAQVSQLAQQWGFQHFILPIMSLEPEYALPVIDAAAAICRQAQALVKRGG